MAIIDLTHLASGFLQSMLRMAHTKNATPRINDGKESAQLMRTLGAWESNKKNNGPIGCSKAEVAKKITDRTA